MKRSPPPSEFGSLLRQYRLAAGLTQISLAQLADLDPTSLNRIEADRGGVPRLSTINRLATALGWSASHENTKRLREAAGYHSRETAAGRMDAERLRDLLARGVAEFNAYRETHNPAALDLNWTGFDLHEMSLRTADFHGMILRKANFENADLVRANLRGANLESAILRVADLRGANLREANLDDADLIGADLRGAYLYGARLTGAKLIGADLRGADLRRSVLREANLRKAWLQRADLSDADLSGASLVETNLMKADLVNSKLDAKLARAIYDDDQLRREAAVVPSTVHSPNVAPKQGE